MRVSERDVMKIILREPRIDFVNHAEVQSGTYLTYKQKMTTDERHRQARYVDDRNVPQWWQFSNEAAIRACLTLVSLVTASTITYIALAIWFPSPNPI
jgi:hypothetical protein